MLGGEEAQPWSPRWMSFGTCFGAKNILFLALCDVSHLIFGSSAGAVTQLRQLLDFYFEPFTLQHNRYAKKELSHLSMVRYLLDLIQKKGGAPEEKGPWLAEALR